jgi:hypothetical protein
MLHAFTKRRLAGALSLCLLLPATAFAGGYGGSQTGSAITSQQAQALLIYVDEYVDGDFRVRHTEAAGATASTSAGGESGYGFGSSDTDIETGGDALSWKRSVQRTSGYAANGTASGSGFSASFVKVRTSDGKYYIFKGLASASASAGSGGATSSKYGIAKSAGGRY